MKARSIVAVAGVFALVTGFGLMVAAQSRQAENAPRVPLRAGLTIVTAVYQAEQGDYESLKTITHVDGEQVRLTYAADVPHVEPPDDPIAGLFGGGTRQPAKKPDGGPLRHVRVTRVIARADLETATEYQHNFGDSQPESFPGSTAVGVSRRVLTDIKMKGESPLSVPPGGLAGGLAAMVGALLGDSAKDLGMETMRSGTLRRVEKQPVPFKVLLNDVPVELPAVHARGTLGDDDAEFWILDDPDNPLALKWTVGDNQLQVIRLSYPVTSPATGPEGGPPMDAALGSGKVTGSGAGGVSGGAAAGTAKRIEADLASTGRSVIYGIYFDFASDRIKEESEPVLAEIAQVLRQNPTWNLSVDGHTDNIASDTYNLDLSQRRAAAVKTALTGRYQIAPDRLSTAGFGESRPKDRNDTLEGRARNRRVELVKRN